MDVFDLVAKLSLDKSEYENGLSDAKEKGSNFGTVLTTAGKVAGAGIAAVGTAAVALSAKFATSTKDLAAYGDSIDKNSQKLGVSSKFYQEWDAVLKHSGTSMDGMSATFKKLATASQDASKDQQEAFKKLGLSMDQVKNMSTEELFSNVVKGLQGMKEGTERTTLATQLLGRGAMEMGALLNTSAEDTDKMIKTVNDLGGVLNEKAVKASAQFQDNLQDLQTALTGAKNGMMAEFLPSINSVVEGLTKLVSGDDTGLAAINKGIDEFVANLTNAAPKMLDAGASILKSLADAILQNLPKLIDTASKLVLDLAGYIVQALPQIVQVGMQTIVSLAEGIANNLPTLIPTIVETVLTIVETLIDNVDKLIDAAIAIITGLADGIMNALPILLEKAPVIIAKLVTAIIEAIPKLVEAAVKLINNFTEYIQSPDNLAKVIKSGVEIVVSLVKGIIEAIPQLIVAAVKLITALINAWIGEFKAIIQVGKDIVDTVKDGFMQKVNEAREWGKDLIHNFIQGIKDAWQDLKDTVSDVAQSVKDRIGFSEPKLGPLSNFHTYAPDMMNLFIKGIEDNEGKLQRQVEDTFDFGTVGKVGYSSYVADAPSSKASGTANSVDLNTIITLLREYLPNMGGNVYIDGNTLVGSISNGIDTELGRMQLLAARGM